MIDDSIPNGCRCSVCGEWQYWTPSGMTCSNGHGGAPGFNVPIDGIHEKMSLEEYRDELLKELREPYASSCEMESDFR